jgi:cell division protease FtsH
MSRAVRIRPPHGGNGIVGYVRIHGAQDGELREFGRLFRRFLDEVLASAPSGPESDLLIRLREHLGQDPRGLPVVTEAFPAYDHANVQQALDAYLAEPGRGFELVGIAGQSGGREHHTFSELIEMAAVHYGFRLGAVDYVSVPVGVDVERSVVHFGLYLISDRTPCAVLLRGSAERYGRPMVQLEILSAEPATAQRLLAEIRGLMVRHNVFRGQVVSFESHEFGHGLGPLRFHARPTVGRSDVVLPAGVLEAVERQIVGVATHRETLRAAGHALKRGVLLFGPPGAGKTHTARYLISQLPEFTVVLLTGMAMYHINFACSLARMVQPALVVLEDVDLIAEARDIAPGMNNPLLYQVLNEMDGLAGDADVAFLLTTNRADLLEPALAQRPGRVDLAIQVPLPDATARRRLCRLYGPHLALTDVELDEVVTATDGATGSYFAELARRATLLAATTGAPAPTVAHVRAALAELRDTQQAIAAELQPPGPSDQFATGPARPGHAMY